ncbi:MAG: hypothetical protein U0841_22610 [Chloroflexia bacterium]
MTPRPPPAPTWSTAPRQRPPPPARREQRPVGGPIRGPVGLLVARADPPDRLGEAFRRAVHLDRHQHRRGRRHRRRLPADPPGQGRPGRPLKSYTVSGSSAYDTMRATECFATEADAQAAGYRKSAR